MRAPRADAANPLNKREFGEIKRLRWSYVAREYDQASRGYVYSYVERLGKIAGHVLEALLDLEGAASVAELAEAVGAKRARDLSRRQIARLEDAGVVTVAGARVSLADDWREKLGIARELGGEYDAERRTRERHARARRAFRARKAHKADHAPTEAEMDADPRREHRRKVRRVDVLVGHGMRADIACREVFGADGFISDLRRGAPPEPPKPERRLPPRDAHGVYVHGPECGCWICGEERTEGAA